jgi:XTP/dITP diphosphohydrolase
VTDLLVATNNPGKLAEFRRLLSGVPARVVGPAEVGIALDVPEPHHTYEENATEKARAFCRASGLITLADDSGIEAAALDWRPGVRSARYGGPHVTDRAAFLLEQLDGATDRRARMVCALALGIPPALEGQGRAEPRVETFHGVMEGSVAPAPRGDGGFGYDPIFLLPSGLTTAQLPEGEKNAISHRGKAVASALPRIRALLQAAADRGALG